MFREDILHGVNRIVTTLGSKLKDVKALNKLSLLRVI